MCKKLCVFAGTTEGRELIELLEGGRHPPLRRRRDGEHRRRL